MPRIEDFGNKIGGARKDLWKLRGLIVDDLEEMNDAEKAKYIKKDNVWQKPDYQKMLDDGLSVRVIYFIKQIRDALPTKPARNTEEYLEGYIQFVSEIRDRTMSLNSENDVLNYFQNVIGNYVQERSYTYEALPNTYECLTNKLFKAAQVRNFFSIDKDIEKKQFLYTEEQKILSSYKFVKYSNARWEDYQGYRSNKRIELKNSYSTMYLYPVETYSKEEEWKENTWIVLSPYNDVLYINFPTKEEAQNYVLELSKSTKENKKDEQKTKTRKKKFVPKQLEHIKRVGDDYRQNHEITTNDMLDKFGFYGGEFGNWLNDNDRQENLNYSYDAFVDLAKALNISNENISLNGELSIAYGARGIAGAAAHYEPLRRVINLTKMSGAGSLAHEWGHAFDHFLGRNLLNKDKLLTETNDPIIKPIIDSMKYKMLSPEEASEIYKEGYKDKKEKYLSIIQCRFSNQNLNKEQKEKLNQILSSFYDKNISFEEYYSAVSNKQFNTDAEKTFKELKNIGIRNLPFDLKKDIIIYQKSLNDYHSQFDKPLKVETDYYKNSRLMDLSFSKEDKGYWASNCEMFARAFACYVKDKLAPDRSDYLCGHAESCATTVMSNKTNQSQNVKAYPEGEERKNINDCIDKLISLTKEKGLFQDYNQDKFLFKPYSKIEDVISNDDYEQTSFMDYNLEI